MPLKWLGGAWLIGLSVAYCAARTAHWQAVKRTLRAWVALLNHTKTHISCFGTPLSDILKKAPPKVIDDITGGRGTALSDFTALCRRTDILPDEARRLLFELSDEIGTIWRKEQLERLSYYVSALEQQERVFCSSLSSKIRLHGTLSLCGALALILLIW